MVLVGLNHLVNFAAKHADARSALAAFQREVEEGQWVTPADLRERYPKASFVGKDNVVFDIRSGNYRLHARVNFATGTFIVMRIGTHAEYNRWKF